MSIFRLFRLGIRAAAWATPHVQHWHRNRNLNFKEGERHLEARNWSEAEKHITLALEENRARSGKPRVELLMGLEKARRHQAKFAEAEQAAHEAIAVATKSWREGVGAAMESLVELQIQQRDFAAAEQSLKQIEQMEEAQSRPDHARLARCFRRLGTVHVENGHAEGALKAFEQATLLSEQIFGPAHLETANALAELAVLQRRHGSHELAEKSVRRALEIHRAALGPNSHEATHDLHVLAGCLAEAGNLAGAMGEYERVLAMKERQVGGDRQQLAETQVHLAVLYLHADRVSAARELLIHAVGTLERKGGAVFMLALETLAEAEDRAGRASEAQRLRAKMEKILAVTANASAPAVEAGATAAQDAKDAAQAPIV